MFANLDRFALRVARDKLNNFYLPGSSQPRCEPFYVGKCRVGSIREEFLPALLEYTSVFERVDDEGRKGVQLASSLQTYEARTDAVNNALKELKNRGLFKSVLDGWRDENYGIYAGYRRERLFGMERAACGFLGVIQYGAHVNGYVRDADGSLRMWLGKRSPTKQTYPNHFDNLAAGGLSDEDSSIRECMARECNEEAAIPFEYAEAHLRAAGVVTFCFEDYRGVIPEVQHVFDVELPADFVPQNKDGEMQSYKLYSVDQLIELLGRDDFKPNCAGVVIDFFIRHGIMTAENCPHYVEIMQFLHTRFPGYD